MTSKNINDEKDKKHPNCQRNETKLQTPLRPVLKGRINTLWGGKVDVKILFEKVSRYIKMENNININKEVVENTVEACCDQLT
jgi:hypothetical protein